MHKEKRVFIQAHAPKPATFLQTCPEPHMDSLFLWFSSSWATTVVIGVIFGLLAEGNMTREDRAELSTRSSRQRGPRALRPVWEVRITGTRTGPSLYILYDLWNALKFSVVTLWEYLVWMGCDVQRMRYAQSSSFSFQGIKTLLACSYCKEIRFIYHTTCL